MGSVINLRQARKNKKRADKERQAETNRAYFGQSKAEKDRLQQEQSRQTRQLDGHQISNISDDKPATS